MVVWAEDDDVRAGRRTNLLCREEGNACAMCLLSGNQADDGTFRLLPHRHWISLRSHPALFGGQSIRRSS